MCSCLVVGLGAGQNFAQSRQLWGGKVSSSGSGIGAMGVAVDAGICTNVAPSGGRNRSASPIKQTGSDSVGSAGPREGGQSNGFSKRRIDAGGFDP